MTTNWSTSRRDKGHPRAFFTLLDALRASTSETARLATRLAVGAQQLPDARVLYLDELMPREVAAARPPGLFTTIRADVPWHIHGSNQGTAPDMIMATVVDGEHNILFIEIDRGTDTIVPGQRQRTTPRFWRDTSFLRKLLIYAAAYRAKAHQRQLGLPVFRVLTVVPHAERVTSMQAAYQQYLAQGDNHVPPGLFLFTDWDSVNAAENVLTLELQNGGGRVIKLAA